MTGTTTSIFARKRAVHWTPIREKLREVAMSSSEIFWLTEPDGYCLFLNRAWTALTGQNPDDGTGFGWIDMVHPDDRAPLFESYVNSTAVLSPVHLEYRLHRRKDAFEWVIAIGIPFFDDRGDLQGYSGSIAAHDQLARSRARSGLILTPREREAVHWAAKGLTAAETAEKMGIVGRTVDAFLVTAAERLGTSNKTQTVVEAIRRGEISL